jgi:hypothetical protein
VQCERGIVPKGEKEKMFVAFFELQESDHFFSALLPNFVQMRSIFANAV